MLAAVLLALLSLTSAPLVALAQERLTKTFTTQDGSFAFKYPTGWATSEDPETGLITLSDSASVAKSGRPQRGHPVISIGAPGFIAKALRNPTALKVVADALMKNSELTYDLSNVQIGDFKAIRGAATDAPAIFLAVQIENRKFALITLDTASGELEDVEPTFEAIAASFSTAVSTAGVEGALFQDDFEAGALDGWDIATGEPSIVEDRGNQVLRVSGGDSLSIRGGDNWKDYALDMRVKMVDNAEVDALLGLRSSDKGGYVAYLSTKLDAIGIAYLLLPNTFNALSRSRAGLNLKQWYDLRLTAKGNRIDLFLNKKQVNWINSKQLAAGTVFIGAFPGAEFYVDDVVVTALPK
jgi:hypothetical protein